MPVTTVRQLVDAGDLRDGDVVPGYCTVRWLRTSSGFIAFGPTNEDSEQQACLPVDMPVWVERDAVPGRFAVSPYPTPMRAGL